MELLCLTIKGVGTCTPIRDWAQDVDQILGLDHSGYHKCTCKPWHDMQKGVWHQMDSVQCIASGEDSLAKLPALQVCG